MLNRRRCSYRRGTQCGHTRTRRRGHLRVVSTMGGETTSVGRGVMHHCCSRQDGGLSEAIGVDAPDAIVKKSRRWTKTTRDQTTRASPTKSTDPRETTSEAERRKALRVNRRVTKKKPKKNQKGLKRRSKRMQEKGNSESMHNGSKEIGAGPCTCTCTHSLFQRED